MTTKKTYIRPVVSKTMIDREISLVMMSVNVYPMPSKLLRFLR